MRRIEELGVVNDEAEGDYSFDLSRTEEDEIKDRLSDLDYIE